MRMIWNLRRKKEEKKINSSQGVRVIINRHYRVILKATKGRQGYNRSFKAKKRQKARKIASRVSSQHLTKAN